MINVKRLKSAKRSAIFVVWSSLLLFSSVVRAQEKPWEVALCLQPFNTHYEETATASNGDLTLLAGNSFSVVSLQATVTYRARRDLNLPLFISVEPAVPVIVLKGTEVGSETEPDGTRLVTSKEDVRHTSLMGRALLGLEILPFLQPYVAIERGSFASRRTNQQDGTESGGFTPDISQDYTETILSTQLGFGIEGAVPLNENADCRIRYDLGYEIPQTVSVSNTYFGAGEWGQGTTGYTYGGRIEVDLPLRPIESLADNNCYLSIGALASKRHWNGDGRIGFEIAQQPYWPANSVVEAGGFIGIGMFF
jgi:hypothetical protein